jgi:osmotically-inducible protein OsmY
MTRAVWAHRAVLTGVLLAVLACKKERAAPFPASGAHPNRGNQPAVYADEPKLRDEDITQAVRKGLARDPGVDVAAISVKTSDGIVELTGKASNILTRRRATMIAEGVKGVRAVNDRLILEPRQRSDAEIRNEVRSALLTDAATDSFEVDVKAMNGAVTLSGTVESWQEKTLAGRVAEGVRGVREVKNELGVDYRATRTDAEIAADVRSRFRWDRLLNDGLIDVAVEGGRVTLRGIVGSAAERRRAHGNAWVNGTKVVDDSAIEVRWWAKEQELRKEKFTRKPDGEIADAIRDSAALDPRIESARLSVDVNASVATLRGSVQSAKAKMVAEALAKHTVGVGKVKNELVVHPAKLVSDAVIEDHVRNALLYDPLSDSYEIQVNASDGTVTLEGTVETTLERAQANDLAAGVNGVKRVENRIDVRRPAVAYVYDPYIDPYEPFVEGWHYLPARSTAADAVIASQIEKELAWSPFVDADEVKVAVSGGKATLTGTVDSLAERSAAVENALEGGAVAVEDRLRVDSDR